MKKKFALNGFTKKKKKQEKNKTKKKKKLTSNKIKKKSFRNLDHLIKGKIFFQSTIVDIIIYYKGKVTDRLVLISFMFSFIILIRY